MYNYSLKPDPRVKKSFIILNPEGIPVAWIMGKPEANKELKKWKSGEKQAQFARMLAVDAFQLQNGSGDYEGMTPEERQEQLTALAS